MQPAALVSLRWIGLGLLIPFIAPVAARAEITVPKYRIGETSAVQIITPVPFMAVNRAATEKLRQDAMRKEPVYFRHNEAAADNVDRKLNDAVQQMRRQFRAFLTNGLYDSYPLAKSELETPKFKQAIDEFKLLNKDFPFRTDQARAWARGTKDDSMTAKWRKLVKEEMTNRYIRPDGFPREAGEDTQMVKLIPASLTNTVLKAAEKKAKLVARTNLVNLTTIRKEFITKHEGEKNGVPEYLAKFLRPNCEYDRTLSSLAHAAKTEDLWAADHYQAGDTIVKRGQIVDARVQAALQSLQSTLLTHDESVAAAPAVIAPSPSPTEKREANRQQVLLFVSFSAAAFLGAVAGGWFLLRRRRLSAPGVPALWTDQGTTCTVIASPGQLEGLPGGSTAQIPETSTRDEQSWEERARNAEAEAARASNAARAALDPKIEQVLKDKAVQTLASQKAELLAVQKQAEQEVARLEELLIKMQAPQETRLRAFEKRIAELEAQMATQGTENRELIQAVIRLTRQKLADERAQAF